MSLSHFINQNKAVSIGIGVVLIIIALVLVAASLPGSPDLPDRAYFTVDDGETWFADSISNIPPYIKDGKEAVRAYVYKTKRGKVFVAHLERYTPESKAAVESALAEGSPMPESLTVEVKRPGDKKWVRMDKDPDAFNEITSVRSPDDPYEPIEPVVP